MAFLGKPSGRNRTPKVCKTPLALQIEPGGEHRLAALSTWKADFGQEIVFYWNGGGFNSP